MTKGKSTLLEAARRVRDEIYAAVRERLADESMTYQQVADSVCVSLATVQRIAQRDGISRPVGPRPKSSTVEMCDGRE